MARAAGAGLPGQALEVLPSRDVARELSILYCTCAAIDRRQTRRYINVTTTTSQSNFRASEYRPLVLPVDAHVTRPSTGTCWPSEEAFRPF